MGSKDNRRVYGAVLGLAAIGLVLDRTVFDGGALGPESAQASPVGGAAPTPKAALPTKETPDPTSEAVAGLVARLKRLEESGAYGPGRRADAFRIEEPAASAGVDAPASPTDADSPARVFRRSHTLRTVLSAEDARAGAVLLECRTPDRAGTLATRRRTLRIGEEVGGFVLESIDAGQKGVGRAALGSATFVSADGQVRVTLVVPGPLSENDADDGADTGTP